MFRSYVDRDKLLMTSGPTWLTDERCYPFPRGVNRYRLADRASHSMGSLLECVSIGSCIREGDRVRERDEWVGNDKNFHISGWYSKEDG